MKLVVLCWSSALCLLTGVGLLVCASGHCVTTSLDRVGLSLAHALSSPGFDAFIATATWLGSIWLLLPLAGLIGLILWRADQGRQALFMAGSLLGASVLAQVFKVWVARPRPELFPAIGQMPLDAAYPSAHTMQAVAMAMALSLLAGRQRAWAWPPLALAAVLVAWSRVHLQVHYPTDVLAGALAACLWVAGLHRLLGMHSRKAG